jgi:hypothetical protein
MINYKMLPVLEAFIGFNTVNAYFAIWPLCGKLN